MNRRIWWLVAGAFLGALPVYAQDQVEEPAVEAAEPPAPEVVEAWAAPREDAERTADHLTRESDSFARIHDADEALLELEAAQRMVGFDLLDGVR